MIVTLKALSFGRTSRSNQSQGNRPYREDLLLSSGKRQRIHQHPAFCTEGRCSPVLVPAFFQVLPQARRFYLDPRLIPLAPLSCDSLTIDAGPKFYDWLMDC